MEENRIIDLKVFWKIFVSNVKWIVIITLITSFAGFFLASAIIPKQYSSSSLLYVENKQGGSDSFNINDINAA